jgi:hypothetical protein
MPWYGVSYKILAAGFVVGMIGFMVNLIVGKSVETWSPLETRNCEFVDWTHGSQSIYAHFRCGRDQIDVTDHSLLMDYLNRHASTISCTRMISSVFSNLRDDCEL